MSHPIAFSTIKSCHWLPTRLSNLISMIHLSPPMTMETGRPVRGCHDKVGKHDHCLFAKTLHNGSGAMQEWRAGFQKRLIGIGNPVEHCSGSYVISLESLANTGSDLPITVRQSVAEGAKV